VLIESLENRQLMSVSLDPVSGTLTILGTKNDDRILVEQTLNAVKVTDNGAVHSFAVNSVGKLRIEAREGSDQVRLSLSVLKNSSIDSGPGKYDTVLGGGGRDTIHLRSDYGVARGGGNNDLLNLYGRGELLGEAGNDRLVSKHAGSSKSYFDGGAGFDTMDYSAATLGLKINSGTSGQYIPDGQIPPPLDLAKADATWGFENFWGGAGDDYITGTPGNNELRGNAGKDTIRGQQGNDTIYGGAGKDFLYGDDGDDTFYAQDGEIDAIHGGTGLDKAQRDGAIDILNSIEGIAF